MARFKDKFGVASTRGFFHEVMIPGGASLTSASHNGALMCALVPVSSATTSYTIPLPNASYIVDFAMYSSTAFSAGATLTVGTTAGAADLLAGTAFTITAAGNAIAPCIAPKAQNTANPIGTPSVNVFVTLNGAPAAGAGTLVVRYLLADPYGSALNPAIANKNQLI